jgi:methionyl-tRNA synthetase
VLQIQEAAKAKGKTPAQFCDEVSEEFRSLMVQADISNDQFIRTTEERHKKAVHALWKLLEVRLASWPTDRCQRAANLLYANE